MEALALNDQLRAYRAPRLLAPNGYASRSHVSRIAVDYRQGRLESLVIDPHFWRGRRVFLTGHTGFKGAWMTLLLRTLGAKVTGFSLAPEHAIGIFCLAGIETDVHHEIGDIRDLETLKASMERAQPEIVIHMAAQALVRRSFLDPIETYSTNVMGTVQPA